MGEAGVWRRNSVSYVIVLNCQGKGYEVQIGSRRSAYIGICALHCIPTYIIHKEQNGVHAL